MQTTGRKKTDTQVHGGSWSFPFFYSVAGLCALGLVALGCARLPLKVGQSPVEYLRPLCLESKGKGRIVMGGNRFVFSYQTAFREDGLLALVLDIPLRGEEYVLLDLEAGRVSGSLGESMPNMEGLARLLNYRKKLDQHGARDCRQLPQEPGAFRCGPGVVGRGEREVTFRGEDSSLLVFSRLEGFYKRIRWHGESGGREIVLNLFLDECKS